MMNDVVKSSIYGFVIADALGVPIEFTKRQYDESKKLKEMVGFGSHHVPEGTWSDDTSMTLATMDSIQEKQGINYEDIMNKFLQWYEEAYYTATDQVFDIGNSTMSALNRYASGISPLNCGGVGERDNGNGSLMRMLPVSLYIIKFIDNDEEAMSLIKNISSLTHAHNISILGCKIYHDYLSFIIKGYSKEQSYEEICKINYEKHFDTEVINLYSRILSGNLKNIPIEEIKSSGYVISTLEASIWSILNNNTYEDSVVNSINLGADTDTVGAITGSIAGMIYGYNNIPDRWVDKLRKKDYLDNLINSFNNFLENGLEKNPCK